MNRKRRDLLLASPIIGLLPFLVLGVLDIWFNFKIALLFSFLVTTCLLIGLFLRMIRKRLYNFLLIIDEIILGIGTFLALLPIERHLEKYTGLFITPLLLIAIVIVLSSKQRILRFILSNIKGRLSADLKRSLYEFFYFCRILVVFLSAYLGVGVSYLLFFKEYHTPELHRFIFEYLMIIMISSLMIYEYIYIHLLQRTLRKEDWLPIIDVKGRVIGKIARTVSYTSPEHYLHPRIRLYIFYKGRLFLAPRKRNYPIDPLKYDTPLCKDLSYQENFEEGIESLIRKIGIENNRDIRFIFRHIYHYKFFNRMNFMYKLTLDKDCVGLNQLFPGGKFWTENEIENNKGKGVFTFCFESECEFLQSTIFPVEQLLSSKDD